MSEPLSMVNTHRLLFQVLARYGSVEAFGIQLRRVMDDPTIELPALDLGMGSTGRHRLRADLQGEAT